MNVRLVFARCDDGFQTFLFCTTTDFDVETWAKTRERAFRLLGITRIIVEDV